MSIRVNISSLRSFMMAFVTALFALVLCSCATHKTVDSTDYRDSVRIMDSVNVINKTIIKDSVRLKDSVVFIVNQSGEIIGQNTWHWREKISVKTDTEKVTGKKYKVKKVTRTVNKKVYVEKKVSLWDKILKILGYVCFFIIISFIGFFILRSRQR